MQLFVYEGYRVKISPEAMALKVFKKLWDRDTSEDKTTAMQELSFIYFYCDPRSDYQIFTNPDERLKKILEGEGMNAKWKPDKDVKAAMDYYNEIKPMSALMLEDARMMVNNLRDEMKSVNFHDGGKSPLDNMKTAAALIKLIPELVLSLKEAEDTVKQEIIEAAKARGSVEQTILDDDLDV